MALNDLSCRGKAGKTYLHIWVLGFLCLLHILILEIVRLRLLSSFFYYYKMLFLIMPSSIFCDRLAVETDLQSGAQYKYELLWIILVASCAALIIQSLAANLGVVTGKHLAEHCRIEYPKVPNFILWVLAEIAVVACDIPEGNNAFYVLEI
ncbi:hypothetical protein VitviT2T_014014 [Vitis vinifera]|uniref:Uncharacterized protein n=1 Tax=Vitis vinifera TaxID=29760 RepID=A0ABY9CKM8_VITVI|nr:hypothetical protein VitviT2T_014014 [Vitis vinifera]